MAKRLFDLVVGAVLGLLALPLILVSALMVAIALHTTRPFFVQKRVGRHGQLFRFVKIRTLPVTAPAQANKYAIANLRLPHICRTLRATHLDELPQLLLVITGKMSLVGPRPEMPSLLATFDEGFVAARSMVRPGCTGLWQISEASGRLIGEAPEYDLYYLAHERLRLDVWIVMRTLRKFLTGVGAIRLDSIPPSICPRPSGELAPVSGLPGNVPQILYRTSAYGGAYRDRPSAGRERHGARHPDRVL